jgi:hypothetical protein
VQAMDNRGVYVFYNIANDLQASRLKSDSTAS